eukprot:1284157-Lingulodinium_polyedra.AAC.1
MQHSLRARPPGFNLHSARLEVENERACFLHFPRNRVMRQGLAANALSQAEVVVEARVWIAQARVGE